MNDDVAPRPHAATSISTASHDAMLRRLRTFRVMTVLSGVRGMPGLPQPEPIHQIVQRGPAYAQELRGLAEIAVDACQNAHDGVLFGFIAHLPQIEHRAIALARRESDVV